MADNEKTSILEKIFAESGTPLTDEEKARLSINNVADEPEDELDEEAETDDETVPEDDPDVEETDDTSADAEIVEPVQVEAKKPTKNLDKKEVKIVNLKDEKKSLLSENRELKAKLEAYETEKRRAELRAQYGETHDEVSADILTEQVLGKEQLTKQIETLTFKAENPHIMTKYPDAKNDVDRIMTLTKSTGATIEQVCEIMYGDSEPLEVRRNKASVKGELPNTAKPDYTVSNAGTASITKATTSLTPEERTSFSQLKKAGVFKQDDTIQEYLKYTRRQ